MRDVDTVTLYFATASSGNLTVKFKGAITDSEPTWGSAQSASNVWDFVEVSDLESGDAVDGDTGISVAGTDDVRQFEVNVNGLTYLNADVTARSAGNVTVKATTFTDQV